MAIVATLEDAKADVGATYLRATTRRYFTTKLFSLPTTVEWEN